MANSLDTDLTGKLVVVEDDAYWGNEGALVNRIFRVDPKDGGFGAKPYTSGRAIFGHWVNSGRVARIEGWTVERVITQEEAEGVFTSAGVVPHWGQDGGPVVAVEVKPVGL